MIKRNKQNRNQVDKWMIQEAYKNNLKNLLIYNIWKNVYSWNKNKDFHQGGYMDSK